MRNDWIGVGVVSLGVALAGGCGDDGDSSNGDGGTASGDDATSSGDGATSDGGSATTDATTAASATSSGTETGTESGSTGTSSGAAACDPTVTSDLPGVSLELDSTDCTFTLAEAAAGITVDYHLQVDADLDGVAADEYGSANCVDLPAVGLFISEILAGDGQRYCECDYGLCAPWTPTPATLAAGSFPSSFDWDGRNWNGPSDTGQPKGDPFPAGEYVLELKTIGTYDEPGAGERPFEVLTTVPITLVE